MWPSRKTSRLHFGRITRPGANYFVTASTKGRVPVLVTAQIGQIVADTLNAMHLASDIELLAATIMPDHVHFLYTLGERLDVGQVMGKLKTMARDRGRAPWRWERDGFEHQVRSHEVIEDYAFYIFMNPYRAGLCALSATWPWWVCPQPSTFRFMKALSCGEGVPAAWLDRIDQVATRIAAGD